MSSLRYLCVCGLLAVSTLLFACGGSSTSSPATRSVSGLNQCVVAQPGYYYLAMVLPYTGALSSFGPGLEKAAQLAAAQINTAGGIHGKQLGLIRCDDATDAPTSAALMTELSTASPVSAVLGPLTSGGVQAAAPIATAAGKVIVSPSGTSPSISTLADDGFVFRTVASDAFQGVIMAAIAKDLGYASVGVIARNDAYGTGLSQAFVAAFADGSHTAASTIYDDTVSGYAATAMAAATTAAPEAIFLVAFVDDGAAIVKQAANSGTYGGGWLASDGVKGSAFLSAINDKAYVEGLHGTSAADPSGADYDSFAADYQTAYAAAPALYSPNAYDAIFLLAMAMQFSTDPDNGSEVRDGLAHTHAGQSIGPGEWAAFLTAATAGEADLRGASGPVDFDEHGDVVSNFSEWAVVDDGSQYGTIQDETCWTPQATACP